MDVLSRNRRPSSPSGAFRVKVSLAPESLLGPSAWRIPVLILTECGVESARRGGPERIPGRADQADFAKKTEGMPSTGSGQETPRLVKKRGTAYRTAARFRLPGMEQLSRRMSPSDSPF